jgi:hypothetical protein
MLLRQVRNVCQALPQGVDLLVVSGTEQPSRDGPVLVAPEPVTTEYERPCERVLFSATRDANPFFHLFESMWMLTGSNDARWLDTYVRDFSARYAEADGTQHGAYGHRWRSHFDRDQLHDAIEVLRADPNSRQAVVGMWDPAADLGGSVRDRPCNLSVALRGRVRRGQRELDITVFCRSNDIWMGAHGANAVHMSILQEYLAAHLGWPVGHYWQVSSDYHIYLRDLAKTPGGLSFLLLDDRYTHGYAVPTELFSPARLLSLSDDLHWWTTGPHMSRRYEDHRLFGGLLVPMAAAHRAVRDREFGLARSILIGQVTHVDWRMAAVEWVDRREARHRKLTEGSAPAEDAQ